MPVRPDEHRLLLMKRYLALMAAFAALSCSPAADDTFWVGADISGITGMEKMGEAVYGFEGDEPVETTALMKDLGCNAVRLRVWVDPPAFGPHGLESAPVQEGDHRGLCDKYDVLEQALRARRLGMEVMIDFHYSDWWADPKKQPIPRSWMGHDYDRMRQDLKDHTVDVLSLLKDNGVCPKWVQVGNETRNGLLWNIVTNEFGWEQLDADGNVTVLEHMGRSDTDPEQYAGFLDAGYEAVKSVLPDAVVIVHLDNGYDSAMYDWNLGILEKYGTRYDMVGMSLYPYWAAREGGRADADGVIADCMANVQHVWERFGKESMIVETGVSVDESDPSVMAESVRQMALIMSSARASEHCHGVFYWNPTCRPSGGYSLGAFGSDGRPTAIMSAFTGRR